MNGWPRLWKNLKADWKFKKGDGNLYIKYIKVRVRFNYAYITIHKPTSDRVSKPMMRKKVWLVVRVATGQSGGGEKQ